VAFIRPGVENRFVGSKPMHEGCCACLRPADEQEVRGLIVPTQSDSSCLSRGDTGIERRAKVCANYSSSLRAGGAEKSCVSRKWAITRGSVELVGSISDNESMLMKRRDVPWRLPKFE